MRLRAWLAWFWLLVFTNAVAPKSFLHAFHAHEETCHAAPDITSVSSQHEHCDFLLLKLLACEAVVSGAVFTQTLLPFRHVAAPVSVIGCGSPSEKYLRGPPVC